jgi:hypothetical protein
MSCRILEKTTKVVSRSPKDQRAKGRILTRLGTKTKLRSNVARPCFQVAYAVVRE